MDSTDTYDEKDPINIITYLLFWIECFRETYFNQNIHILNLMNLSNDNIQQILQLYYTNNPHMNPYLPLTDAFKIAKETIDRFNVNQEETNSTEFDDILSGPPCYLDNLNQYTSNNF